MLCQASLVVLILFLIAGFCLAQNDDFTRDGNNSCNFNSFQNSNEPFFYANINNVRRDLLDAIYSLAPRDLVPFFNISLTGQIGAGKSSSFNSFYHIFMGEVVGVNADVGIQSTSLTKEYTVYQITRGNDSKPLPWRICDTMGLEESKSYDVANILMAVEGHLKDKSKFPDEKIHHGTHGYEENPELKDKAHCVAVVINGKDFPNMTDAMKEKLKTLRDGLIERKIPTYILLTHIDEACDEVCRDVKNVYRSIAIRDLVDKVGKMLHGLPENQIFPVMNYKGQVELEDGMDILLLYALRQMLRNAKVHLGKQRPPTDVPVDTTLTPEGELSYPVMESMPHAI